MNTRPSPLINQLDAFGAAYRRRGHAPPFPTRESAAWLCRAYIDLDPEGCALARSSSEIVGVGFAHPRGAVGSPQGLVPATHRASPLSHWCRAHRRAAF